MVKLPRKRVDPKGVKQVLTQNHAVTRPGKWVEDDGRRWTTLAQEASVDAPSLEFLACGRLRKNLFNASVRVKP
jgi:hypothetical protein